MHFDTLKILEMLSLIHEDLDLETVERRFFSLITEIFGFDRLALLFVRNRNGLLQGRLSHGFQNNEIEKLGIPLSPDNLFTMPLITGLPVWNKTCENDPVIKALGLTNFAIIPVMNRKRLSCWEVSACQETTCPAHGNLLLHCWLVADCKCSVDLHIGPEQKRQKCELCPVFHEDNSDGLEGILLVDNSISGEPITDHVVMVLALICHTVGAAINNAKRLEQTLRVCIKDYLTGIHNRRYFNERLVDELERVARYPKEPATLVMVDIDLFKEVNDKHGHPTGDFVLVWFAGVLASKLRKSDVVARYGGEEFAILLINTNKAMALEVAEGLRQEIASASVPATGISITASFGVATFGEDASTPEELIAKADKALYQAKANGRNLVCLA